MTTSDFRGRHLEKWVVLLLGGNGRQWAVAGAEQRFVWKSEDLFADFLLEQFSGLFATSQRAGEQGVTDHGNVRRIFGPGSNDVGDALFGMAGRIAVGDAKAA